MNIQGNHQYINAVIYQGWWVVPVDCDQFYTFSCFDPRGTRYRFWQQYPSIEEAIGAGKRVVRQINVG